ncbi:hypothetical protein Gpo141_00009091 [Globisporangium polare]
MRRYPLFLRFHVRGAAVLAAEGSHFEALQLIHAIRPDALVNALASQGGLEMIKWLHELDAIDRESEMNEAVDAVLSNGHPDIVKWLVENHPTTHLPTAIEAAMMNDHLQVAKWLRGKAGMVFSAFDMERIAARGDMEMLTWLDEQQATVEWATRVFDAAVSNGHVAVLEYLHTKHHVTGTYNAHMRAAKKGHLEVLQCLHERVKDDGDGCSARAMDGAAANDHLEVIRFLHENRSEGCTSDAMDGAAGGGHLEVVEFVHEHLEEGCSIRAMELAVVQRSLEIVKGSMNTDPRAAPDRQ